MFDCCFYVICLHTQTCMCDSLNDRWMSYYSIAKYDLHGIILYIVECVICCMKQWSPFFNPMVRQMTPPPFSIVRPPFFKPGTTIDPYISIYGVELCTFFLNVEFDPYISLCCRGMSMDFNLSWSLCTHYTPPPPPPPRVCQHGRNISGEYMIS